MKRWFRSRWQVNEFLAYVYQFLILLLIYAVCRVLFYLFNMPMFPGVTFSGFLTLMKGGMVFDVSALLYLNVLYFLLVLFPGPWKQKVGFQRFLTWMFMTFNSVGLALNVIDFKYYPFILKRTTANVADILKNESNMGSLAWQFVVDYWYMFLVWGALVGLLLFLYKLITPRIPRFKAQWLAYPIGLVALTLFTGFTIVGIRGGYRHSTRPITLSNAGEYVQSPEEVAIVLNTPFSIIRTIGKKSFEKMAFFASDADISHYYTPIKQPSDSAVMNRKNVVVIILESFSREHFGSFNATLDQGNYKGYTPFLDSLCAHSLVFPNAYANGRKSIDALPSVTASLPALVLPYVLSEYSSNKVNSLASLLGDEGYGSAFFHGAPNGSMGFQAFTNMTGFKKYMGRNEFNDDTYFDGIWGIWDEEFFQFFSHSLSQEKEPFLGAVFSLSSHHPYKVPTRYEGKFPAGNMPLHQCVGYTDNALRQFFATASKEAWFNNTLFVITADHSTFPWHDEYKTNINSFAIPLIFYTPDGSLKGVDQRLAQQTDILPTVLSHLNYPHPYVAFGNDLIKGKQSFVMNYVGGTYQFMQDSLVMYFDGKKVTGVYDFIKDPALTQNIQPQGGFNDVEQTLKAVLQQYNNRMLQNDLVVK